MKSVLLFAAICSLAALSSGQTGGSTSTSTTGWVTSPVMLDNYVNGTCPCDDIVLDVPNLSVGEIALIVENLTAHVSVNAEVLDLVTLNVGVDLSIEKVNLTIAGVAAKLKLTAKLNNVYNILSRTLDTVDRNPELLPKLVNSVGTVVQNLGGLLTGVLSTLTNSTGLVQRLVDSLGNVVTRVLDPVTNNILSQVVEGSILDPPNSIIANSTNALGQTVLQVRDVSGGLVSVVLNSAGQILSTILQKL